MLWIRQAGLNNTAGLKVPYFVDGEEPELLAVEGLEEFFNGLLDLAIPDELAAAVQEGGGAAGGAVHDRVAPRLRGLAATQIRVADPNPDGSGPFFGRIRSRKIFTGYGFYRYLGNLKLYEQGKNILKTEVLHIFR